MGYTTDSTPGPPRQATERYKATAGLLLFIVLLAKVGALCATSDPSPRARGSSLCLCITPHHWLIGCFK
jgi:hypothetical protein